MKVIVVRSVAIVTFVGLLGLTLSTAQHRHLERFGDLLVMAPRRKTLAQLAALELPGVDASNLADFLPHQSLGSRRPASAFDPVHPPLSPATQ
jgi:hypothetical protein